MTADPLADLLGEAFAAKSYTIDGFGGIKRTMAAPSAVADWLRAHRTELLTALGGEIETSYDLEADEHHKAKRSRYWSRIGSWLIPGDEVWSFGADVRGRP